MKTGKKHIKFFTGKYFAAIALIFTLIISSMVILKPSEIYAAKKYDPSGEWRGKDQIVGGLLSISMYTDIGAEDTVVGSWTLDNYYGHSEGIIKKTSNKNKYKLVFTLIASGSTTGPTYFTMTMKSNKKLKLTPKKYDSKTEWRNAGFSGTFKLSQRYRS